MIGLGSDNKVSRHVSIYTVQLLGRLSTIYNRLVIKVQKWFYHIISQADRHFLEYHHFDPSQITTDFKCRNIKESEV